MKQIDIKEGYTKENIKEIAKVLKSGGIAILPTDTVYGIASIAKNEDAVKKIYELKNRNLKKPMNVLVSNIDMIKKITKKVDKEEEKIINKFFPGALTIIFEKNEELPDIVTGGIKTIGIRSPNSKILLDLIEYIGGPIVATSCNLAGEPAITNAQDAKDIFSGKVDLIVDEGESKIGIPSTIIKIQNRQNRNFTKRTNYKRKARKRFKIKRKDR